MSVPILSIEHLTQSYRSGWFQTHQVFDDFSLELEKGRIYALLGRNGAGKTTLLNCILGLIRTKAGTISFNGEVMTHWNIHRHLDKITSVPSAWEMFPRLTADAYMSHYRELFSDWDEELEERIRKLSDFDWGRSFRELSTGQKMQVLQALALCPCPELLILDEPLGVTDPVIRKYFYRNLIDTVASRETTIVIATHLIQEVANMFDEAIFLKRGKITLRSGADAMLTDYARFSMKQLPDTGIAGEQARLLGESALLSDHPDETEADLKAKGLDYTRETPNIEDIFEAFA